MHEKITTQLIQLKKDDLKLRDKLIQNKQLGNGYNPEMAQLHNRNAEILNEIIETIGYPTIDKVGKEASAAAWLVIQHAIGQPKFMKKCVKLLKEKAIENEVNPIELAYLTDRIAVFSGKPQLYGTQFDWDENGKLSINPCDDLEKVNQRRKAIGLNTVEEQTEIIRTRAQHENETPPADFVKRKKEMEEWRRLVGWVDF